MRHLILLAISALFPILVSAQKQSKPRFDIMTDPISWSDNKPNIKMQGSISKLFTLAVYGDAERNIGGISNNYVRQSFRTNFGVELQYYPFGKPRKVSFKNARSSKCFDFRKKQKRTSTFSGIYISTGYVNISEKLILMPNEANPDFYPELHYKIRSNGFQLSAGYQIRISNITLGMRYGLNATNPTWSGPYDIFQDNLYSTTFPWKLNLTSGFKIETGINF